MDHRPVPLASRYWLPLEHPCGCVIDWGVDSSIADQLASGFLPAAAPYPCPMHGSTTGVKEPPLAANEERYLVASGVWYRAAAEDQRINGERNRAIALGQLPQ